MSTCASGEARGSGDAFGLERSETSFEFLEDRLREIVIELAERARAIGALILPNLAQA